MAEPERFDGLTSCLAYRPLVWHVLTRDNVRGIAINVNGTVWLVPNVSSNDLLAIVFDTLGEVARNA